MSTPVAGAGEITMTGLMQVTGLSMRRLQEMARMGYFDRPIKGVFQTVPTLKGLFAFYRGLNERDIKKEKTFEEHRRLKIANDIKEGFVVERAKVAETITVTIGAMRKILETKLVHEWPQAVAGLDVPGARVYGRRLYDDAVAEICKLDERWGKL